MSTQTSPTSATTPLTGEVALVTGATSGIGRATAEHLAELGAHVLVSGRDVERGEAVVAAIRAAGGKADFLAADLSDVSGARDLAQRAIDAGGGRVDVLVNNAGIFPFGPTVEFSEDDFDAIVAVNLKSPFALVQALVPGMVERGGGTIVNVSSAAGQRALPVAGVYSASKAALDQLTRSWAAEFGPAGVRVNAVSPGPVRTEGTVDFKDLHDELAKISPSGRVSQPADIAAAIGFLAGPGASNIHGTVLPVDGGYLAA